MRSPLDTTRRFATRSLRAGPTGFAAAALWVSALAAIEVLGRHSPSDLGDALGVLGLAGLTLVTIVWHRDVGIAWVGFLLRAGRRVMRAVVHRQATVGVDFRAGSLDPFGYPTFLAHVFVACTLLALFGWFWPGVPIEDLRAALAPRLYVGYLAILTLLWAGVLFLSLGTIVLFCMMVHDAFVCRSKDPAKRSLRPEILTLLGSGVALLIAAVAVNPRIAVTATMLLLGVLICAAILPVSHPVRLVWKSKATGGALRAVSVRFMSAMEGIHLVLAVSALLFIALGNVVLQGSDGISETTPVSSILGRWLAWTGALGGGSYLLYVLSILWLGVRLDPRRAPRPSIHVDGLDSFVERRRLSRLLGALGWKTRFTKTARRADVRVQLVSEAEAAQAADEADRWPARVSAQSILRPDTLRRLARRDEVQRRRRLIKGLETLYKKASSRSFKKGEGFWIGVHHWFILGLSRDESEDDFDLYRDTWLRQHVGPPVERAIDWPARQHLHHVLWCLDLDLIFLEDGVGFRGLRRVLRILFEIHDTYGGMQRAEERMMSGIPGVRVLIQEVGLERSLDASNYPEPDYEDIGRARVLHVFRDRGGDEETFDVPADFDHVPLLVP